MKKLKLLAILFLICMPIMAQTEYFTYEDEDKTIITGITLEGISYISDENSITIPQQVTKVCSEAFLAIGEHHIVIENLIIDGGNPYFEDGALDENYSENGVQSSLTSINLGNGMSENNIKSLFKQGLKSRNNLEKVEINGIQDVDIKTINWDDVDINAVLTEDVKVMLPAALVDNQVFGNAQVYGVFVIPEGLEESTFCGTQMFQDIDVGSNFLFYIPVELTTDKTEVTVKRVRYILPGEGVLMHLQSNTSNKVELPRINRDSFDESGTGYVNDLNKYQDNMLVGVTQATPLSSTDGEYTNMILYNGLFYPTSGGTLNANRAYLQVKTSDLSALGGNKAKLSIMKAQCAKPTITLKENGKVKVECATEDATCVTNIIASGVNPNADGEINLNAPLTEFTITAYATANGYRDSDVVTSTLHWEKNENDVNGDGVVDISDVVLLINMILDSDNTSK